MADPRASKQLVKRMKASPVVLNPPEVTFKGIEPNVLYVFRLEVQNATKESRRIRFAPPKTNAFTVNYEPAGAIAPGLVIHADIEFATDELCDHHDVLVITSDKDVVEVPLTALVARPEISIEEDGVVSFGTVVHDNTETINIWVANTGDISGRFRVLVEEGSCISVTPPGGQLLAPSRSESGVDARVEIDGEKRATFGEKVMIKVDFHAQQLGAFRELITIEVDGGESKILDVNANVVEQRLELLHPYGDGQVQEILFPTVYYGEQQEQNVLLVNNGPLQSSFSLTLSPESGFNGQIGDTTKGSSSDSNAVLQAFLRGPQSPISISPLEGTVEPYSSRNIKIIFKPRKRRIKAKLKQDVSKGDENEGEFCLKAKVECSDVSGDLVFSVCGKALTPVVDVAKKHLQFGDCPTNSRRDVLLSITNKSSELGVSFNFSKVAFFGFKPNQGSLRPNQSTEVLATFSPSQLGEFEDNVHLVVNQGILVVPLKVEGSCTRSGPKKEIVGGPNALPTDFQPKIKFVEEKDLKAKPEKRFVREAAWEKKLKRTKELFDFSVLDGESVDVNGVLRFESWDKNYTYNIEDLRRKQAHRDQYSHYLKAASEFRENEARKRNYEKLGIRLEGANDSIDIGLHPREGLESPRLTLPKHDDPLWVERPFNLHGYPDGPVKTQPGARRLRKPHDENRLIGRKFPSEPQNPGEFRDCDTALSHDVLSRILPNVKSLNFGTVCVNSTTWKCLAITNDLSQSILVEVDLKDAEELSKSTPKSQVLPPGATGGFDICFLTRLQLAPGQTSRVFRKPIKYIVNKRHSFKVSVEAEVVPLVVEVSSKTLEFAFEEESLDRAVSEKLELVNPGNATAQFEWVTDAKSCFSVDPATGAIDPFGSSTAIVSFQPRTGGKLEETLKLRVRGGIDGGVSCKALMKASRCFFKEKLLDFGVLGVADTEKKAISLKNTGKGSDVFYIQNSKSYIQVTPECGHIASNSTVHLEAALTSLSPQTIDGPEHKLVVALRSGHHLKLPIKANVIEPDIRILEPEFSLGGVTIGAKCTKTLTLENKSNIKAVVTADLSKHPEFTLVANEDTEADAEYSNGTHLTIAPGSTLEMELEFAPKEERVHSFNIPLKVSGVDHCKGLERQVDAEGLRPRLLLSASDIFFGSTVINSLRSRKKPRYLELRLTNQDPGTLKWFADTSKLGDPRKKKQSAFSFKPFKGELQANDSCSVQIGFLPQEAKTFNVEIPLYLDEQQESPYLTITLKGEGILPKLSFSTHEIVLPAVPLGMKSTARFMVKNDGYDSLELQTRLPSVVSERIPLEFSFPAGKSIGVDKPTLPVDVSFTSMKPVSSTIKAEFLDADGKSFGIFISAATENCLLTSFPFVSQHSSIASYDTETTGAVTLQIDDKRKDSLEQVEASPDSKEFSFVRYLNNTSLKIPIQNFPADFISSNGQALYEVIEECSGKEVKDRPKKLSTKRIERVGQLIGQYQALITFLTAKGAYLHNVRPELLLSFEEYELAGNKLDEDQFGSLSLSSWSSMVYQTIKIFVLNRITRKHILALPGIKQDPEAKQVFLDRRKCPSSNIYSYSEQLLLQWMNYHHKKGTSIVLASGIGGVSHMSDSQDNKATHKPITNFGADLADGTVLCTVLVSHLSSLILPGKPLCDMTLAPQSDAQGIDNLNRVKHALKMLGLTLTIDVDYIATGGAQCARNNLLLCLYLFDHLPQYIPKAEISFSCVLGEQSAKAIELKNPFKFELVYTVSIEGSSDFNVGGAELVIEPQGVKRLEVLFQSRFSHPVEALLSLKPQISAHKNASTLVFQLRSDVHSRKSTKTIRCETTTYAKQLIDVEVSNPFAADSVFGIELIQQQTKKGEALEMKTRKVRRQQRLKSKKDKREPEKAADPAIQWPNSFHISINELKLESNGSKVMQLEFMPIVPGEYRCQIVFLDPNHGEFVYEIIGLSKLPLPLEKLQFNMTYQAVNNYVLKLPSKNSFLESCLSEMKDRNESDVDPKLENYDEAATFSVRFDSPFFKAAATIVLNDEETTKQDKASVITGEDFFKEPGHGVNVVPFEFRPKAPGLFPAQLVLNSPSEIRVYAIVATVTAPPVTSELEFITPARQAIVQEIPIVNSTTEPWTLTADLNGSSAFSGPRSLVVGPDGQSGVYRLSFKPSWIGKMQGKLLLHNPSTNETMTYNLTGHAEEPLAEDHVVISCKARERVTHDFSVKNDSKVEVVYVAESDVPHVSGDSELTVPPGSEAKYNLHFHPLLGGTYTGSLTLSQGEDKPYIWYTIELQVANPEPEDVLDISAAVRKAVSVEISLANPLPHAIEFDVAIQGGGLLGEEVFTLPPEETRAYELIFAPLITGTYAGSISFRNDQVGEVWYELNLEAKSAPPVSLDPLSCPVGSNIRQSVSLENPSREAIQMKTRISNSRNFSIQPSAPLLKPYETTQVDIVYTPSSIGELESGTIAFYHPKIGEWRYMVSGSGEPPSTLDPQTIESQVGQSVSSTVMFRNPFPAALALDISAEEAPGFRLLSNVSSVVAQPFSSVMIPFSFSPSIMRLHSFTITAVARESGMSWTLPVQGIVEAPVYGKTFEFKTKCRELFQTEFEVLLHGIEDLKEPEGFTYGVVTSDEERRLVKNSLSIRAKQKTLTNAKLPLEFAVDFQPLTPFTIQADLVVTRKCGGRWRFPLKIVADEPDVDDTIRIEASLNQTASVSFKLTNLNNSASSFEAYFTPESPHQFSVHPSSGILEAAENDGTIFVVSYTPTEYGREKIGKLVIRTNDMVWSYAVRGRHPRYKAPSGKRREVRH